jgi:hypothetical protein
MPSSSAREEFELFQKVVNQIQNKSAGSFEFIVYPDNTKQVPVNLMRLVDEINPSYITLHMQLKSEKLQTEQHIGEAYKQKFPHQILINFFFFKYSVPVGAKLRNTPSACEGDRKFEDFVMKLAI